MSAFRADIGPRPGVRGCFLLIVLGTAMSVPAHAWAQDQVDAPESPQVIESAPLAPPTPLLPFDASQRNRQGAGPSADTPTVRGIEINPLSEVDPDTLGVLEEGPDGLGRDLWRGTSRAVIEELMASLPDRYQSVTLRGLASRLLLSSADIPAAAPGPRNEDAVGRLLALRVERLSAMGDLDGLTRLLDIVPRHHDREPIARARVDNLMLAGNVEAGCMEVRNGIALYVAQPFWRRALVLCQLARGETVPAELGLALLREQGLAEDAGFVAMVDILRGTSQTIDGAHAAEPIHFALLLFAGHAVPADLSDRAGPGLLAAMAVSPSIDLDAQTAAAERALQMGAIGPDRLNAIYARHRFDPAQVASRAQPDTGLGPVQRRALVYQQALRAGPADKPKAVERALVEAGADVALYPASARVLAPLVTEVTPQPDMIWLAGPAGRALFAAGHYERARAWFAVARQAATDDPAAAKAAADLWPYSRLAGSLLLSTATSLETWGETRGAGNAAELAQWKELLGALFEAFEEQNPYRQASLVGSSYASLDVLATPELTALKDSGEAGRRGETMLRALVLAGTQPLARSDPELLKTVVSAIARVGLYVEARALAIEAALASGI